MSDNKKTKNGLRRRREWQNDSIEAFKEGPVEDVEKVDSKWIPKTGSVLTEMELAQSCGCPDKVLQERNPLQRFFGIWRRPFHLLQECTSRAQQHVIRQPINACIWGLQNDYWGTAGGEQEEWQWDEIENVDQRMGGDGAIGHQAKMMPWNSREA